MVVLTGFGGIEPKRSWLLDELILGSCFAVLYAVAWVSEAIDRRATDAHGHLTAQRARRRQRSAAPGDPPSRPPAPPAPGSDAPKSLPAKVHSPRG